ADLGDLAALLGEALVGRRLELEGHGVEGFVEAAGAEEVGGLLVEAGEVLEEQREPHVEAAAEVADEAGGADALALGGGHAAVEEGELEALGGPLGGGGRGRAP